MLSGRDALQEIDRALSQTRITLNEFETKLAAISDERIEVQRKISHAIDQLARLRLDELSHNTLHDRVELADREVLAILEQRKGSVARVTRRLDEDTARLTELEAHREEIHAEVDAAAKALANREAEVQRELDGDDAYLALLNDARDAEAIAVAAQEKTDESTQHYEEKAEAYKKDALFMYLWRRGYGTSAYRANLITRLLDGWVARIVDFEPARVNYWTLTEIPVRLKEHAAQKRLAADATIERVRELEASRAELRGVPELQADLYAREEKQASKDRKSLTKKI